MAHSQHFLIKKHIKRPSQPNTQILNLRKQLNQYLHHQQLTTQQLNHKSKGKSIKDYLNRWYSKNRKSEILRKKMVKQQQPLQQKPFIKQPRRKGSYPYSIHTQLFKKTTTLPKPNIPKYHYLQNKSKNYDFIFAHLIPNKRYTPDQSSNFITKNQPFNNQQLKPVQLQPWPKVNQQYTIFDF